ncbi:50S ribosomal protein L19 [Patescibacteria group bacterium]|nr:50S ribosomal protein L19 [Patescibacteria group bacterium]
MVQLKDIQEIATKKVPNVKVGNTVKVHQKIKEGDKERIQIFEGLVIAINSGHGADKTFTVRKIVEGIGVEKIFPLYSPNIAKIEITKLSKIRRAKLYYMRERSGKSARLKASFVKAEKEEAEVEKSIEELAEIKAKEEAEKAESSETPQAEAPVENPIEEEAKAESPEKVEEEAPAEAPAEAPKEEEAK